MGPLETFFAVLLLVMGINVIITKLGLAGWLILIIIIIIGLMVNLL